MKGPLCYQFSIFVEKVSDAKFNCKHWRGNNLLKVAQEGKSGIFLRRAMWKEVN
jgi:hypothetical protein